MIRAGDADGGACHHDAALPWRELPTLTSALIVWRVSAMIAPTVARQTTNRQ